jgi:transposase
VNQGSTQSAQQRQEESEVIEVAGLDVGDKECHLCVMAKESGEVQERSKLRTTRASLRQRFAGIGPMRIALEAGAQSPWISRLLSELGHRVVVGNPRKLRLIYQNRRKNDQVDAEYLARLARVDPALLHPLEHRGEEAQADLSVIRSRELLVKTRVQLVNHVRGVVKSFGERLPKCDTEAFARRVRSGIPPALRPSLLPVVETIATLSAQIRACDRHLERAVEQRYREASLLMAVNGVGVVTALSFVLVLESPERFAKSRAVGAYLGLVPAQADSGDSQPQLRITREGDELLRRLLVQCGHYILGPFGKECDLRRHGQKIAQGGGGKRAKKRAVVAVARKLSVLLHRLWRNGEVYDPDFNVRREQQRRRPAA